MSESRKQYAKKNIRYAFLSKILTLVLAFVSRTVFIWGLGTDFLGLNTVFGDVLNLLSMLDFGFGIAMVYSFYEPLANQNQIKISGLITYYRKVYIMLAVGIALIGIAVIPTLSYIIKLDETIYNIEVYYLLSLTNVVFSYVYVYKSSILIADQKNYVVIKVSLITNFAKTVFQVICIILFKSYLGYLVIGAVVTLVNNIIISRIAEQMYPYINEHVELSFLEKKSIYKNLISVFLFKLSNVLMNATDNILISIIVGTLAVGYYSNYFMIHSQITAFYALFFTSVTASVGNLIVTEKPDKRFEIFNIQQSAGFVFACIIVPCYVVLINEFISVWLGKLFTFDILTVAAIGINVYLSCILQPLWTFREATGLYQKTKWIMIICALINLMLSVVLGKAFGIAGILFASAVSRLLTYIWYEPKLLFKEFFERKVSKYYFQLLVSLSIVTVITIISFMFSSVFPANSLIKWICKAIFVCMFCSFLSVLIYRKSPFINELIKMLITKKLFN